MKWPLVLRSRLMIERERRKKAEHTVKELSELSVHNLWLLRSYEARVQELKAQQASGSMVNECPTEWRWN